MQCARALCKQLKYLQFKVRGILTKAFKYTISADGIKRRKDDLRNWICPIVRANYVCSCNYMYRIRRHVFIPSVNGHDKYIPRGQGDLNKPCWLKQSTGVLPFLGARHHCGDDVHFLFCTFIIAGSAARDGIHFVEELNLHLLMILSPDLFQAQRENKTLSL